MRRNSGLMILLFGTILLHILHTLSISAHASINNRGNNTDLSFGFIENKGQMVDQNYKPNPDVKFIYAGKDIRMHLREGGFSYELFSKRKINLSEVFSKNNSSEEMKKLRDQMAREKRAFHRIDIELVNSNKDAEMVALEPYSDYINYYTGTPNGVLNVKHYGKVIYKNIYPNIDVEFELGAESKSSPKYNFIVHPGGKISDILIKYKGSNKIELRDNKLFIQTSLEPIVEDVPLSYQKIAGGQKNVNVVYRRVNENTFTFAAPGGIDNRYELVIDPVPNVSWGTYYGNTYEYGMGITFDPSGNVIACGESNSISNIASGGGIPQSGNASPGSAEGGDAFIAKFNGTTGARVWCTFYGGAGWDGATAIKADASGNVYFTGWFADYSPNANYNLQGPSVHQATYGGGEWDAVVVKLNTNGARQWGTFFGGDADDEGWGITVDGIGNVIIGGNTKTANNTGNVIAGGSYAHQAAYGGGPNDSFIAKFSASNGSRVWSTYYGGSEDETDWHRSGLDVDSQNNIVYASWTTSTNAISFGAVWQSGLQGGADAFLVKFNPAGTRLWGTYYGGTGDEYSYGAIIDANDNIIIAGETTSSTLIASTSPVPYDNSYGGSNDAFVAKFSPIGVRQWGTYFGGPNVDRAFNIDNICSNILVYGTTAGGWTTTGNAHQSTFGNGTNDAFIFLLNSTGTSLIWSTYYGGNGDETAYWDVCSIASNSSYGGNEYAIVGSTTSTNQIAYTGSGSPQDLSFTGGWNSFVAKFDQAGIQVNATASSTICSGRSVTLSAAGATTYSWAPGGQTTSAITVSPTTNTTYTVTGSDITGCQAAGTLMVTVNASPTPSVSATGILCLGQNTTLTASGGTSYSWSNGATTTALSGVPNGTYTVTATNSFGCTNTATGVVNQAALLTNTVSSTTPVSCFGGSNGTASTTVSGGTSPYTYLWASGGQTTTSVTGLSVGTYTITVRDFNGCSSTRTVSITQPAAALSATLTSIQAGCTVANGTATANPAGGTSPYTYLWTGGKTTQTATGLSAGTYTVLITDTRGCTRTNTISITATSVPNVTASFTQAGCTVANGTATANPSGGTGAYTYLWSPGGQTASPATGLSAGTYTILLTDNNGCTRTNTVNVTATSPPLASTSAAQATCGNNNGSATASASGGTGSSYTYVWSNGQSSTAATGLAVGIYTITVTDMNGCTDTDVANISNANGPAATTAVTANVLCFGGNNGAATVSPSAGTPPYTYSWSNGQTTTAATGLTAGTHTITVTDANGCPVFESAIISQPTAAVSVSASSTNVLCFGGTSGTATVTPSGGTPGYTYLWNPSAQTTSATTGLSVGTYTVDVTDSNGCAVPGLTTTVSVAEPTAAVSVSASSTNVLCFGGTSGTATVTPAGGVPGYTYLWTPSGQTTSAAAGLSAGTYTIDVTDSNGCAVPGLITTVSVAEPTALTVSTTTSGISCGNGTDGVASTTNTAGGIGPYTYDWAPVGQTTPTISNLSSGTYTLTVTDANNCSTTEYATILAGIEPLANFDNTPIISCRGVSTQFTDESNYALSWNWNFGEVPSSTSTLQNPLHVFTNPGTYSVTLVVFNPPCQDTLISVVTIGEVPDYVSVLTTNVFTPNGDGINDCFSPAFVGPGADTLKECMSLEVFDRWGVTMFESIGATNCWSGNNRNDTQPAVDGTYFYVAKIGATTIKGYTTLMRNKQ